MPIIHRDLDQGTDEWFALRLGLPTASRFKDLLAGGKGLTRTGYMLDLACELLTGVKAESYSNSAMEWGTQTEPQARESYSFINDADVDQVCFIQHDDLIAGYSPDGLIGANGLLEIKCPNTKTHIETVLSGKVPTGHTPQLQGGLWIAEREWIDFVSFDPRIKSEKQFFCVRVFRDEAYINNMESEVLRFQEELTEIINKIGK